MQQKLPFSIGFHTLLFLFTGCALPVLCISSVCLSRLLFSCPQARNYSVLKGCMAPCLQLFLTLPSIDKAARWITAYLSEIILFSAELPFMDCTPVLVRFIHPHHASVFKLTAHETKLRLLRWAERLGGMRMWESSEDRSIWKLDSRNLLVDPEAICIAGGSFCCATFLCAMATTYPIIIATRYCITLWIWYITRIFRCFRP